MQFYLYTRERKGAFAVVVRRRRRGQGTLSVGGQRTIGEREEERKKRKREEGVSFHADFSFLVSPGLTPPQTEFSFFLSVPLSVVICLSLIIKEERVWTSLQGNVRSLHVEAP